MKTTTKDMIIVQNIRNSKSDIEFTRATTELFDKYKDAVVNHCKRKLSSDDAEYIAIDALSKGLLNLDFFDVEKGAFSTWLYTLVNRCIIDYMRKNKEQVESLSSMATFDSDGEFVEYEFTSKEDDSVQLLMKKEKYREIAKIVNSMENKNHSKVIVLRFFHNMSYEEISTTTNIPLGTVKGYVHRAIKTLRVSVKNNSIFK